MGEIALASSVAITFKNGSAQAATGDRIRSVESNRTLITLALPQVSLEVVADAVIQGQLAGNLPGVLGETAQSFLAQAGFVRNGRVSVVRQAQQEARVDKPIAGSTCQDAAQRGRIAGATIGEADPRGRIGVAGVDETVCIELSAE